jgi:hypothetical protein
MKNNENSIPHIATFDFNLRKWPYPAYTILKPLVPYVRSVWGHIRPVKGSRRPFLSFLDTKYHFNNKGALNE